MNESEVFDRAVSWLETYCLENKAMIVNTKELIAYPEVTGYYIPTLLKWGYQDKALCFAQWLCSIQNADGSWNAPDNSAAYVFDSAQVLKGLVAAGRLDERFLPQIKKGCEWIASNILENGRLTTPVKDAWGDGKTCSELVHLYCLTPLMEADNLLKEQKYSALAKKVLNYYKKECLNAIKEFGLLSHFYAYVMEALVDLGEAELAREAMLNLDRYQLGEGKIPAYRNVSWVCSTGLFQLALVWYKLNELERGNNIFRYACTLQNPSGGWYGSYATNLLGKHKIGTRNTPKYFADAEISWAVKYYLDALDEKKKLESAIKMN